MNPPHIAEQITNRNKNLVLKIARKYTRLCQEEFEDLHSVGMLGLYKAALRFDESKGFKFSSLACLWIRGEILHYLRDRGKGFKVPSTWRNLYMKGFKYPDEQAAIACRITLDEWQEIKQACSLFQVEWETSYEKSWEPEEEEPLHELERAIATIRNWMSGLGEDDRLILQTTYFDGQRPKGSKGRLRQIIQTLVQQKTAHEDGMG